MAEDLLSQVRGFGTDFTPEQIENTRALYAPHVPRPTPDIASVTRDVSYGPHERNRLDLFAPAGGASGAPVVLFVHGGGFVGGDKGGADEPFYNNVGAWAARQGFVGATMTYRLAPDHPWPAGARDVAAAIHWLRDNAAGHGGDPDRIVAVGHSAGGAHVAGYLAQGNSLAHGEMREEAEAFLAGAVLVSGIYDVQGMDLPPPYAAYFGEAADLYPMMSALPGIAHTSVPLLLTVAELDPPDFRRQAEMALAAGREAAGAEPELLRLAGHNHISPTAQIGTDGDTLGPVLSEKVAAWTAPP